MVFCVQHLKFTVGGNSWHKVFSSENRQRKHRMRMMFRDVYHFCGQVIKDSISDINIYVRTKYTKKQHQISFRVELNVGCI